MNLKFAGAGLNLLIVNIETAKKITNEQPKKAVCIS
jgi:hypothetical protein